MLLIELPDDLQELNRMNDYRVVVNFAVDRIKKNQNCIIPVVGGTGCLTGNTLIQVNRKKLSKRFSLEHLYYVTNPDKAKEDGYVLRKHWSKSDNFVRSFDGNKIGLNLMERVIYSGEKEVFEIILENGYKIKATADHLIMTGVGWKRCDELMNNNSEVMIDTLKAENVPKFSRVISVSSKGVERTYDIQCQHPHHNFVANGIVVHNSGKSLGAIFLAEHIQRELNGTEFKSSQIVYKGSQFLDKLQGENQLPNKSVIIWDEVSVFGLNARRSMSNLNILLNNIFNTFRHQQYVVFLTTPDFANIDLVVRKLCHMILKTEGIDYWLKRVRFNITPLNYNSLLGRIYQHRCHVIKKNGDRFNLATVFAGLPSPELRKQYERDKLVFTDELNRMVAMKIKAEEEIDLMVTQSGGIAGGGGGLDSKIRQLTPRDKTIWEHRMSGKTSLEISELSGVKEDAIRKRVKNIAFRLGVEVEGDEGDE